MAINFKKIKEELLNRLRNADLISVAERGVTTTTDNFTGDGNSDTFILSNNGIKNIREVTVDSVVQTPLVDYTYTISDVDSENKKIVFSTNPADGASVDIQYDFSSAGDRIYDDFPKIEIKQDKYPRIGFDIISESTNVDSFDRVLYQTEILFSFAAYGFGRNECEDILSTMRDSLIELRNDLQRLDYIEPRGRSRIQPVENTDEKIFKRSIDFAAPVEFERLC